MKLTFLSDFFRISSVGLRNVGYTQRLQSPLQSHSPSPITPLLPSFASLRLCAKQKNLSRFLERF